MQRFQTDSDHEKLLSSDISQGLCRQGLKGVSKLLALKGSCAAMERKWGGIGHSRVAFDCSTSMATLALTFSDELAIARAVLSTSITGTLSAVLQTRHYLPY